MSHWKIYYRGSLSSCNYACEYCPFAKTKNTRAELKKDQAEVERFTDWVSAQTRQSISILFTPWGEALGHRYYRHALVKLSHLPQVRLVSIQTNLSAPIKDLQHACLESLALWSTYHPEQVTMERFLRRCQQLKELGIRHSVGIVGIKEHLASMESLRCALAPDVYLWVNAYKRVENYYQEADLERIRAVDPHFDWNNKRHPSFGKACDAGYSHFTVDGGGEVRACHFVGDILGNIYRDDINTLLNPRSCPLKECGCYIGYIHRPELKQEALFGANLLARIPVRWGSP